MSEYEFTEYDGNMNPLVYRVDYKPEPNVTIRKDLWAGVEKVYGKARLVFFISGFDNVERIRKLDHVEREMIQMCFHYAHENSFHRPIFEVGKEYYILTNTSVSHRATWTLTPLWDLRTPSAIDRVMAGEPVSKVVNDINRK